MASSRRDVGGVPVPDSQEELHIYQAVAGAWPFDRSEERGFSRRLQQYVVKMAREAKLNSSWVDPNERHERALQSFVRALLSPSNRRFRRDLDRLLERIALPGALNALSLALLKITAPGVPDFYQGTELWNFSLVDPDNRRPVDFGRRRRLLEQLDPQRDRPRALTDLLGSWRDGRIKLFVTKESLRFRRDHRDLFERGAYLPISVTGRLGDNVLAFARSEGGTWSLTAVPRLAADLCRPGRWPLGDVWSGTTVRLPARAPARFRNVLTGEELQAVRRGLSVPDLFAAAPVALISAGA